MTRSAAAAVLALGLLLLALAWATRYQFIEQRYGDNTYAVRMNRYTGATDILFDEGWVRLAQDAAP